VEKERIQQFVHMLESLYTIPKSRFITLKEVHPDSNQFYIECIKYSLFPKNLLKKQKELKHKK